MSDNEKAQNIFSKISTIKTTCKEVPAIPSMYHAEIYDDKSVYERTAFLTRRTYNEVLEIAESFIKTGQNSTYK